jgi:hypothetical protein
VELKARQGEFNVFRRFQITHLEKSDCPEALKHFWSGNVQKNISVATRERDSTRVDHLCAKLYGGCPVKFNVEFY